MSLKIEALLAAIDVPADWVGLRRIKSNRQQLYIRDGRPQSNRRDYESGLYVEVLHQGCFAYVATANQSKESIASAARRAMRLAELAARHPLFEALAKMRPRVRSGYGKDTSNPDLDLKYYYDFSNKLCQQMQSYKDIATSDVLWISELRRMELCDSAGTRLVQQFPRSAVNLGATAMQGGQAQRRTYGGMLSHSYQIPLSDFDMDSITEAGRTIASQASELLNAQECPTGKMPVLIAPDQMMLQIHESIGHPLEVDRILGDERNYAGTSFVKKEDFGNLKYGSDLLNIIYDPLQPGQLASFAYDDGGGPARPMHLIKDGLLVAGIGGLESKVRSNLTCANSFRATSWNRAPIDRMANINLQPGTSNFKDLLEMAGDGVMMESNRSWSIDDSRLKFQFGCEFARLIKKGRLGPVVRNPGYRGVTTEFWHKLIGLGNTNSHRVYGTPYCGKGEPNQIIAVGHASPACLFDDVEVFGGND